MPRKNKPYTTDEIWEIRGNWYEFHFTQRRHCKTIIADTNIAAIYRHIMHDAPQPGLGVVGNAFDPTNQLLPGLFGMWPPSCVFIAAAAMRLDNINYEIANPWYWSDSGWSVFQKLWSELPEPVDFVHIGMCTTQKVVQLVHRNSMQEPPRSTA